ncbi:sterol-binding protein [Sulfurifustis variabilis]|uniref:Ubiquinone biosynthesis accessory factor UbiT n=1 Tax=Sulfurifustis variabilis TaxID=1675686 RepID=A0A1B4VCW1_9GAMM|nr:SCP2 sterol-binding domain-containing protein [Sulfurifustis variabilis]BAU46947.1 sterol-binding protein [Sulfurifustis variabilis]
MLPDPLTLWLRAVPDRAHTAVLAAIFTHLLRGQPLRARLAELAGKRVRLEITDGGSVLDFEITPVGLRAAAGAEPHVRIRGRVEDFLALALRREDPDTLFFNRRLSLEGETEAGLHVKNLLDALEYDLEAHVRDVLGGAPARLALGLLRATPLARRLSGVSGVPRARS